VIYVEPNNIYFLPLGDRFFFFFSFCLFFIVPYRNRKIRFRRFTFLLLTFRGRKNPPERKKITDIRLNLRRRFRSDFEREKVYGVSNYEEKITEKTSEK